MAGVKTASTSITRGRAATLRPTGIARAAGAAVVSLKPGPDGQRRRKKVSGKTKTEVRAKLAELHDELNDGVVTNASYTVAQAINDWLADGLAGRAPKTVSTQREVLDPLIGIIGAVPLRELTASTVRSALNELAATRATPESGALAHRNLMTLLFKSAEEQEAAEPVGQPRRAVPAPGRCGHRSCLCNPYHHDG